MNKDLEKEYKELVKDNVPDLWDRIEARLEPKQSESLQQEAVHLEADQQESAQPVRVKINWWRQSRVWGMAAAACLCLMIAVPVIYGKFQSGGSATNDMNLQYGATSDGSSYTNHEANSGGRNEYAEAAENAGAEAPTNQDYNDAAINEDYARPYCSILAVVTEVVEEEDRKAYFVQIDKIYEDDSGDLAEGEIIKLHDENGVGNELVEGESYEIDFEIFTDDNGETEYVIYGIWEI